MCKWILFCAVCVTFFSLSTYGSYSTHRVMELQIDHAGHLSPKMKVIAADSPANTMLFITQEYIDMVINVSVITINHQHSLNFLEFHSSQAKVIYHSVYTVFRLIMHNQDTAEQTCSKLHSWLFETINKKHLNVYYNIIKQMKSSNNSKFQISMNMMNN